MRTGSTKDETLYVESLLHDSGVWFGVGLPTDAGDGWVQ